MIKIGNNAATSQNLVINHKEQTKAEKDRILRLIFSGDIALINNKKEKTRKKLENISNMISRLQKIVKP